MPNQNHPLSTSPDAQPVADKSAGNDEQRDPEQQVDQNALAARLAAAGDRRGQEQAGADPADADPNDRRLDMHVAQEVERQDSCEVDAVEAAPVIIGVRHDRAGDSASSSTSGDHDEILANF